MAKILVVDDSMETLLLFKSILKYAGHQAAVAKSKYQLKDYLKYQVPDLVILDVILSGANGRELCRELKEANYSKDIPIVLISSNIQMLKDYKECGATDFILKPFNIDIVLKKIDLILAKAIH